MSDNVSYAATAGAANTAKKATGDKNGKDITTYMAKAEWDTTNNTTLHLQDSSGKNIFSAKLADKFLPLVAGSTHPLTGDLHISAGNEDRFLHFSYTGTGYDWRIGYLGSGTGNENYLVFQSDGTDGVTWTNALRFGLTDLNATFGGSILPSATKAKDIGSSSLRWNNVYATTFTGNLTGTATKATSDSSGNNIASTYLKSVAFEDKHKLYGIVGNGAKTLIGHVAQLDDDDLIPLEYLPAAALERIHLVNTEDDRLDLTILEVQNGDVVRVNENGLMYLVYDDTKLGTEDAFRVFVAGSAASADTARYAESAGRATNDSNGNKISKSYIKYPFTLNDKKTQVTLTNGEGAKTTLDYNYYPTAMTWTGGTSAGPTATIDMEGTADIAVSAIPTATKSTSGIVIVGTQTFGGAKTFDSNVTVQKVLAAGDGTQSTSTITGAVKVSGGLGVTKNTWIGGTLNAAGATALSSTLSVTGAATLSSTLNVTGATTLTGKLTAKGAVQLGDAESDAISIVGDTSFTNDVTIGKTLTVTGAVTTKGTVTLGDAESDTVTVNGDASFKNDVTITKTLTVSKQVKIGNGADISTDPCDLEVAGGVDVGKNLRVTGGTADTATIEFKQEAKVVYDSTKNAFNFIFN